VIGAGPVPHFENGWQSAYQFRPTVSLDLPIAAFNAEPWRDLGCAAEYLAQADRRSEGPFTSKPYQVTAPDSGI